MKGFLKRKILDPVVGLLKQGVAPEPLAWALATGAAIGVMPLFGITTSLCVAVAAVFRLNQVAIQVGNYALYPFQLALLIPFLRLGEYIFGSTPVPLHLSSMIDLFSKSPSGFFEAYGKTAFYGTVAWALVVPVPVLVLQRVLRHILRRTHLNLGGKG